MKRNITSTTLQVTAFSTVEKAVSFLYRIILSRLLGAEGVGIYQICLSVFAVFLTAASGGIPITVTRSIAKERALSHSSNTHAVVTAGIVCTLLFTIPASLILLLLRGAPFLFGDERCSEVFLILLPGLILTSIYAVMRGVFWGNKQFFTYSLIELLEDVLMVIVGTVLLLVVHTHSAVTGAKLAMLAVTVSYVFSFSASLFVYRKHGGKFKNPKPELKPMLASSLPVTAMRTSSALLNSFVALLLPFLLRKVCGYSSTQATALYGVAMGMALPVLCMPTSFIGSIAVVIAPELSENYYKNHTKLLSSDIHNSIGIGLLIAIFLIPVLTAFGNPIGQFLYSNVLSGQIISRCAILLLPLCLSQISTTILNSLNCEKQTLLFYFPATTAMLLCTIFLTKFLGIYAYMLGLLLSFTITTVCNLALLHKKCPSLSLMPTLLQSLILTLVATLFGVFLSSILALFLPLLVQIVLGALLTILFTACFVILAMPQVATLFFRLPPVQTAKKWLVSMRKHTARTHHRQQEQKGTK